MVRRVRRELKTKFGWEQIAVNVIVQVVIYLIEKWLGSDSKWVDPHAMPADFCLDDVEEDD